MNMKLPAREDASIDMAPMIDMVFLLLIFFMVASVVTELDKVDVDIPKSAHAKVPEDTKGRMMLSIDSNGQIYDGTTPVTLEDLKPRIEDELEMNENLKILVRADYRVEYKTCKDLMAACGDVGATDIIYATFEE